MEDKILHRIECELLGDEISCIKTQDNSDSEKLEIYSDAKSNTQIHLKFSRNKDKKSEKLVADFLIYEQFFSEIQDIRKFSNDAGNELKSCLEVLKLRLRIPNIQLGKVSVTHPPNRIIDIHATIPAGVLQCEIIGGTIESIEQTTKKYLQNCLTYSSSNTLEYIERYNAIQNIKDPVLKLISLASLVEYIKDSSGDEITSLKQPQYKWLKATRNLVSHGVVDKSCTIGPINNKLGLSEAKFCFDRKDHLNLVNQAIQVYSQELYAYLSNLLL